MLKASAYARSKEGIKTALGSSDKDTILVEAR